MNNLIVITTGEFALAGLIVAAIGMLAGVLLRTGIDYATTYRRGERAGYQRRMREQAAGRQPTSDERQAS